MTVRRAAALVLALVVLGAAAGPAAAVSRSPPVDRAAAAQPATGGSCFPDGGYRYEMGRYGPSMVVIVHTSLFPNVLGGSEASPESVANGSVDVRNATGVGNGSVRNGSLAPANGSAREPLRPVRPTAEGALGIEAQGVAMDQRIVFLRTGVIFTGTDGPLDFLSNPFEPFAVVFDYQFSLPMFDPFGVDANYSADESPVKGIETVPC